MKTFRIVFVLVLGGCLVALAVRFFWPLVTTHSKRSDELAALKAENDGMERQVVELRRKQNEFDENPEAVELAARQEGRVKQGETVFDFGDPAERAQQKP